MLIPTKIEEDQTRTGRPVKVEEHNIDFRVPGLSHAVVKEAEHLRVQERVKKIENHPHREALHADLQQNNVYNPFSKNSKAMIRELGNVELFELCETTPKVQCSHCLLYWNQGIVYCTCGQCLIDSESLRKFNKLRLDALSVPNYVMEEGRCHGARHGKTEELKEYHTTRTRGRDAAKELTLKVNISKVFTIDFSETKSIVNHNSQSDGQNKSAKSWTNLQKKTIHIVSLQRKEKVPRRMVSLLQKKSGQNGPMKLRSDFRAAVSMKNRIHHESGEQVEVPISSGKYSIWHPSSSTSRWNKNWI